VKFRLTYYHKRKAYLISTISAELSLLTNRANFIKSIIDGKLKINNVPRKDIIAYLQTNGFDEIDGSYSYLLSMPIHTLTKEKYEELLAQVAQKEKELDSIKQKDPSQMYKEDLLDLKKVAVKSY
jgi:DNA topoisomerase-2